MRSSPQWSPVVGAVMVLGVMAPSARAQDAEPSPTTTEPATAETPPTDEAQRAENARRAREEFQAGVAHYEAGRYSEAIHSFQVAASLIPAADLWFNIARCHEQLARARNSPADYELAIGHYRRYLTERVDPPDRAAIEANILVLSERLEAARVSQRTRPETGTLQLQSAFDGAVVRVDDSEVGSTPMATSLPQPPGPHTIDASREGFLPATSVVTVARGLTSSVALTLDPALHHRAIHGQPVFAWVAWGLGVASLGAWIGLGIHASSLVGEPPDANQLSDFRTMASYSDAALGAAVGLGLLGLTLYVVESNAVGMESTRTAAE